LVFSLAENWKSFEFPRVVPVPANRNPKQKHPAMKKLFTLLTAVSLSATSGLAQVAISSNYTQNFGSLGDGLPVGWGVYTNVSDSSLGLAGALATTNPANTTNTWANTAGAFKNLAASTGLTNLATAAEQQASTDRSLGLRSSGTFGDTAGNRVSLNFNFSTLGFEVTSLSFDAMLLRVETRQQIWDVQFGLGATPTSWTTLGSWTAGTNAVDWGATTLAYTTNDFGSNFDDQASIWFRFTSLTNTTGSGSRPVVGIDNFSLEVVPEPSTYALLALSGLALAGYAARRRRR
jgi:hypothetical protein